MSTLTAPRTAETLAARLAQNADRARTSPEPEERKKLPLFTWDVTNHLAVPLAHGEVFTDDIEAAQAACDRAAARLAAEQGTHVTYASPWSGDYFTRYAREYDTARGWRVTLAASVVAV